MLIALACAVSAPAAPASEGLLDRALAGPLRARADVVFAVRAPGRDGHWYANFGYWDTDADEMMYGRDGGRLCRLDLRTGRLTVLLDDPRGAVRDPHVHYDGRTVIFSYRKGGSRHYNLYEIDARGGRPKRITAGPWDDIEPIYLPNDDIVFCSSRCRRWVPCYNTQVATLHRAARDGRNIRPLSANVEHDNTPAVLADGRILYMRWEYVDRSELCFHHLWTMNPDGTGQMVYYGNMHPGTAMLDAKPIPPPHGAPAGERDEIVAVFSPGHGKKEHAGRVTIVDPNCGPDEPSAARRLHKGADFRDPLPLGEGLFLAARGPALVLMDARGRTETLYTLPARDKAYWLHEPQALRRRRREPVIPDRTDASKATGRLLLADVRHGRRMDGVRAGEITTLLVLEVLPKPVGFGGVPHALSWWGTLNLERVVGTVPVAADGSAYVELPALRSLFFVALDAEGRSVKRMQSFLTVMPGETTGCVGCHEHRTDTPRMGAAAAVLAAARNPTPVRPVADVPDVLDFPRDIQPILDRHCTRCHNDRRRDGGVNLLGDRGPIYSHAYWAIISRDLVADGRNGLGNRAPRTIGASASRLMKLIDGSHYDARPGPRERKAIRLWIETGAAYAGTYAALSTGNLYRGRVFREFTMRARFAKLLRGRCGRCHRGERELQAKVGWGKHHVRVMRPRDARFCEHVIYNFTRPQRSLVLTAPLARSAGGDGACRTIARDGRLGDPANVFADTSDPVYVKLLAALRDGRDELERNRRFDMPGFRPPSHYVREMKRYGILPRRPAGEAQIDPYATDRAYWRSLHHRPGR